MQILVVEDEVLLARSLKEILEESGHSVSLAYDGRGGRTGACTLYAF